MQLLMNFIQHPRSTAVGLVGSSTGGAAFLYLMNAMHCDLADLSWQTLSTVATMIAAPTIVGGVLKDSKSPVGVANASSTP